MEPWKVVIYDAKEIERALNEKLLKCLSYFDDAAENKKHYRVFCVSIKERMKKEPVGTTLTITERTLDGKIVFIQEILADLITTLKHDDHIDNIVEALLMREVVHIHLGHPASTTKEDENDTDTWMKQNALELQDALDLVKSDTLDEIEAKYTKKSAKDFTE